MTLVWGKEMWVLCWRREGRRGPPGCGGSPREEGSEGSCRGEHFLPLVPLEGCSTPLPSEDLPLPQHSLRVSLNRGPARGGGGQTASPRVAGNQGATSTWAVSPGTVRCPLLSCSGWEPLRPVLPQPCPWYLAGGGGGPGVWHHHCSPVDPGCCSHYAFPCSRHLPLVYKND